MVDLHLNQVVFNFPIKNLGKTFDYNKSFDYKSYKEFYHKYIPRSRNRSKSLIDNYAVRKTVDFTYTISRRLVIFLFVKDNFEYWLTANGLYQLLRNLVDDLEPYLSKIDILEFEYRIINISSSFSLKSSKFEFLRILSLSVLQNYLNEFNDLKKVFPSPLRLLVQGETTNYTLNLKGFGTLKVYSHQYRGTIICKSFESLEKIRDFFVDFCEYRVKCSHMLKTLSTN